MCNLLMLIANSTCKCSALYKFANKQNKISEKLAKATELARTPPVINVEKGRLEYSMFVPPPPPFDFFFKVEFCICLLHRELVSVGSL